MQIIYTNDTTKIEWTIKRNTSNTNEDFTMASVFAFAVSANDVIPLSVTSKTDGVLKFTVPSGLEAATYAIKALWWKSSAVNQTFHPFYDDGGHGRGGVPDIHGGSQGVSMAYRSDLFAITNVEEEATNPNTTATLTLTSHVETYGYDGLSAYELAVLRGATSLTESEWIELKSNNVSTSKIADKAITTAKIADKAVTSEKLADDAITEDKIADGALKDYTTYVDAKLKAVSSLLNTILSAGTYSTDQSENIAELVTILKG